MPDTETQIDFAGVEIGHPNLLNLELKDFMGAVDVPESLENRIGKMSEDGDFQADEVISGLSKINIFVGANNSGKSYIMREILKSDLQLDYFRARLLSKFNETLEEFSDKFLDIIEQQFTPRRVVTSDKFYIRDNNKTGFSKEELINLLQPIAESETGTSRVTKLKKFSAIIHQPSEKIQVMLKDGETHLGTAQQFHTRLLKLFEELFSRLESLLNGRVYFNFNETKGIHRVFIIEHRNLLRSEREAMMTERSENGRTFIDSGFQNHIYKSYFQNMSNNPQLSRKSSQSSWELQKYSNNNQETYIDKIQALNGYSVFDDIAEFFNSADGRRRLEEYEKFLSEEFFAGQEVFLTPSRNNQIQEFVLQIGDEPELIIQNLGTGLQMMILLTLPLFQYDEGIFFIEEPELFMHAGMQRHLMSIFATHERSKNFVFFMTTHSNHIIDASLSGLGDEISTFTIRKFFVKNGDAEAKFNIKKLAQGNRDALNLLGVLNSSVYLANCTIWVEGVTDRLYLSAYIRAFLSHVREHPTDEDCKDFVPCLSYREGVHYAYVFSGGNNIVHWDFDEEAEWQERIANPIVKDICGRAFVIIDSDTKNGRPKAPKRKERLRKLLGERLYELPVNEMENLLPISAIVAALQQNPKLTGLTFDEKNLTKFQKTLLKPETKIGKLIDQMLPSGGKVSYSEESGTVKNKKVFCDRTTKAITYDNMAVPAKELVQTILRFVMTENSQPDNAEIDDHT